MFFSRKKSFRVFVVGKVNRLLVPFFFFFLTIAVLLPLAYFCYRGIASTKLSSLLFGFYNENIYIAGAIWFLMSLFFVGVLFWIITISQKFQMELIILLSSTIGVVGYYIGRNHFELPLWFDTSLTCMPYFALGYLLKNKTLLLTKKISNISNFILAVICIIVVSLLAGHTCYRANHYDISIWSVFVCGVLGFFSIFFLSNSDVNKLRWLQFVGKNSIIILAIHQLIMMAIAFLFRYVHFNGWLAALANFSLTMLLCCLLIPVMLRYLPHVTGQKDLFSSHD